MRDEFSQDTKLVLAHRASLVCSNPYCEASTGGPQDDVSKALNVGVAAHITAASKDGPRYDPELTPEQRSSSVNGIWLCQNCAKLVDNDPSMYTAELLGAWKTNREICARNAIGKTASRGNESEQQRKLRRIAPWKGMAVMLVKMASPQQVPMMGVRPWASNQVKIVDCDEFSVRSKEMNGQTPVPFRCEILKSGTMTGMTCSN